MMDRYTKMCSGCKELQDEWEPKVGDKVYHKKDKNIEYVDRELIVIMAFDKSLWVWLPSLTQLIAMLEGRDCYWELWKSHVGKGRIRYKGLLRDKLGSGGDTPQEAMLKLVAHEKWNKQWQDDKEVWE